MRGATAFEMCSTAEVTYVTMFGQCSIIKRMTTWIAPVAGEAVLAPNFELDPPHTAPDRRPPSVSAFQRPVANFTRRWGRRNVVLIASRVRHLPTDAFSTQVFEANMAFSSISGCHFVWMRISRKLTIEMMVARVRG